MKRNLQRAISFLLTLALVMGMTTAFAGEIYSQVKIIRITQTTPAPEATEEPAEEAAEEVTEEVTEEPAEEAAEEVTEEVIEEPAEEAAEEVTEEVTEQPAAETAAKKVTAAGTANVRLDGDGMSEIIGTVDAGTEMIVLEETADWIKVSVNGMIGYVYFEDVNGAKPAQKTEQMRVVIFTSARSVVTPGETIVLTSRIYGFDGYEIMYQWECDKGSGFEVVNGANGDSLTFAASTETLKYNWRLSVYYR